MPKTGEHTNEHGVRVTEHECDTCGMEFTICPGIDDYPNCMTIDCASYNPDIDLSDEEIERLLTEPNNGPRMVIH